MTDGKESYQWDLGRERVKKPTLKIMAEHKLAYVERCVKFGHEHG